MELRLKPNEYAELKRFLTATKNAKMITEFNKIFDQTTNKSVVKGTWTPLTNETIIEITPENSELILKEIAKHGSTIGDLIRNGMSIGSIPRWISCLKSVGSSIKEKLSKRV